jgi:hypothetical protein
MIQRVTWGSLAVLAALAAVVSCPGIRGSAIAQATDSTAIPSTPPAVDTPAPAPAAQPAPTTGMRPGRGGVGGQIGISSFVIDADYSQGAQPRFAFAGNLRYVVSSWLRLQFSPGLTWSAYTNEESLPFTDENFPSDTAKDGVLALLAPASFQFQLLSHRGSWHYHIGAGPGLYRVWVENRRKVLKDPDTDRLHRGVYLGGSAQIGAERFLKSLPSTSVELTLVGHYVMAQRDEQFPNGFNSTLGVAEVRIGANYYFDLQKQAKKSSDVSTATP